MRARLRPGKILDADGGFLADCTIVDRSPAGARVRVHARVAIPAAFRLLDESERAARTAHCIWQDGSLAGLQIAGPREPLDRRTFLSAAGPYYAVV